eukprot:scaffold4001_cov94-Cylindrotheca_fusiformis.AAC.2
MYPTHVDIGRNTADIPFSAETSAVAHSKGRDGSTKKRNERNFPKFNDFQHIHLTTTCSLETTKLKRPAFCLVAGRDSTMGINSSKEKFGKR